MRRAAGEGGRVDDVRLRVEDVPSGVDHALVAVGAVDDGGDVAAVVDEVVLVKEEVEVPLGNETCNVLVTLHEYWSFRDTACIVHLQTKLSDTELPVPNCGMVSALLNQVKKGVELSETTQTSLGCKHDI